MRAGWADLHPIIAGLGLIPDAIVMLYAPRDENDLGVVADPAPVPKQSGDTHRTRADLRRSPKEPRPHPRLALATGRRAGPRVAVYRIPTASGRDVSSLS
ncbi:hypothetical protein [Ornithinimicrobium panacihumi]|uniref:hypothetical protein n=1 Tax=Ornithinimicrobium panacihumi TaxID=2008449 RepID=UPI003F8B1155